jgi:hypothetical protein
MACNCKQRNEIVEKYGTPEEETILGIVYRNLLKVILFLIALVVGIILVPVIFVVVVYKMIFTTGEDRMIVLPNLIKYFK